MDEELIVNMLILNAFNYDKFKDERFEQNFQHWMHELQALKGFGTMDETCQYFLALGESQEKVSA